MNTIEPLESRIAPATGGDGLVNVGYIDVKSLTVGGSLLGGFLSTTGDLGPVAIASNLHGTGAPGTARISSFGRSRASPGA